MVTDVVADMASGMIAIAAAAAAPVTGGASLLVAGGVGAVLKTAIKASDCIGNKKEYKLKNALYDIPTGFVNGFTGPLTNGLGGAAGTGIAKAFGLETLENTSKQALQQAMKQAGKEVVEETIEQTGKQAGKSVITSILAKQGTEYVLKEGAESTLKTGVGKIAAYGVDMMVDGAFSGAADGAIRAVAEGRFEDIAKDTFSGFAGGAVMAPIIGGGMRFATKGGATFINKINNKITVSNILPDGSLTKFSQGETGDCALLSVLDGILSNDKTSKQIQNSIITDASGDYCVNIGGQAIKVARDSLADETLSDTTGVRIFEQAYKQMIGADITDGGFADVVAKNFGLKPIHIDTDSITDEILKTASRELDNSNAILSLGLKVNADGVIDADGTIQHYFSIKKIDTDSKMIQVVDTYDTSKTLELSFDDLKNSGVSIDGGSLKTSDLPSVQRNPDSAKFYGVDKNSSTSPEDRFKIIMNEFFAKTEEELEVDANFKYIFKNIDAFEMQLRTLSEDKFLEIVNTIKNQVPIEELLLRNVLSEPEIHLLKAIEKIGKDTDISAIETQIAKLEDENSRRLFQNKLETEVQIYNRMQNTGDTYTRNDVLSFFKSNGFQVDDNGTVHVKLSPKSKEQISLMFGNDNGDLSSLKPVLAEQLLLGKIRRITSDFESALSADDIGNIQLLFNIFNGKYAQQFKENPDKLIMLHKILKKNLTFDFIDNDQKRLIYLIPESTFDAMFEVFDNFDKNLIESLDAIEKYKGTAGTSTSGLNTVFNTFISNVEEENWAYYPDGRDIIRLTKFLDNQKTTTPFTVYRGEDYTPLSKVTLPDGESLGKKMKELAFAQEVDRDAINALIKDVNELNIEIPHDRFLSTSMHTKTAYYGDAPVQYNLQVPVGTKGYFTDYNIIGIINTNTIESEFLAQRASNIQLDNICFDYSNKKWIINGKIISPPDFS